VVADLAATTPNLAIPLRDIVSRQGFQRLIPLAGSGTGELQRKVLVEDIRQLYHPDVVHALVDMLNGFLELKGETTTRFERSVDASNLTTPKEAGERRWVYTTYPEPFTGVFRQVTPTEAKDSSGVIPFGQYSGDLEPRDVRGQAREYKAHRSRAGLSARRVAVICVILLVVVGSLSTSISPFESTVVVIVGALTVLMLML
jgi:hypothetical protein